MTHRVFSRNASSSRAIPVARQIQMVIDNPAIPMAFTRNQRGMQGGAPLAGEAHDQAVNTWLFARDFAVTQARLLANLEVHKQYANRILEPFAHIAVVVTSTDWDNFLTLRYHGDALPEMQEIAKQLHREQKVSTPRRIKAGEWHCPFIPDDEGMPVEAFMDQNQDGVINLVRISAARCARVSFMNHEGKVPSCQEDLALHDKLLSGVPLHASPAEHQAMAVGDPEVRSGNFRGWIQYRKTLRGECADNFVPPEEA
jgi:hypothetical protein